MTGKTQTSKSRVYETRKLFDIILLILILSGTLISTLLQNFPAFAVAQVRGAAQSNCPVGAIPDTQSILAVLLDRSGSLVAGSEPTDPDGYSGSATKALADVWPGQFAVIPFFGNDQAPKLGPYAHSDVNGINSIKHYIDNNPPDPNANTPLRAAMEQAKTLFRNGIPACSKIVLITDGVPDVPGTPQQEVNTIESQEISWFHNHGIPISVLGLKIDKSTSDGQLADGLLNAIESKTGAGSTYQHVQNAEDLATDVIGLYATWRGLSFTPVNEDHVNNNYPVSIDPYVDQATIISFYTQGVQDNPLIRNGQAIPQGSIEKTPIDKHYEIDTILNPASNAGTYTVSTVGNAPVSVYALIASNFTLQLVSPTTATVVQPGHKLTIQAHFLNNGTPVVTGSNAPLHTRVIFTLNGQPSQSFDILLYPKSGSDIYEGTYLVPQSSQKPGKTVVEIGTLSISTSGTASFQGTAATRGTGSTIIAIDEPKAQPLPPIPPKPCQAGALQCFLIQNHTFVSIAIPLVLLFILLLFLLLQLRSPFTGKIINIDLAQLDRQGNYQPMRKFDSENIATIYLGTKRSFMDRMLHRNTISSTELQKHKDSRGLFSFDGQQFQLIAPQKGRVVIKPAPGARIEVKRAEVQTEVPKPPVSKSISYDPEGRTNTTNNATLKEATTPISTQLPLMSGDIVRIDNHDNFMFL